MEHPKLDTIFDVVMPKGIIYPEGILEINNYLCATFCKELPDNWDWRWTVGKGEWAGTFPKRVSNYLFKTFSVKMTPSQMSRLGDLAMPHVSSSSSYRVDFTRKWNWSPGDFGDSGSCYWKGRKLAKEYLLDVGAFAMRFWSEPIEDAGACDYYDIHPGDVIGLGRAWVVPLDDVFVLFNHYIRNSPSKSYGVKWKVELSTLDFPRVLAQIMGISYRSVELENRGDDSGLIYINGDGYAIGPSDALIDMPLVNLDIDADVCECELCDTYIYRDDARYHDGCLYCESCYGDNSWECDDCGDSFSFFDNHTFMGMTLCDACYDNDVWTCGGCGDEFYRPDVSPVEGAYGYYCMGCVCSECGEDVATHDNLCDQCYGESEPEPA